MKTRGIAHKYGDNVDTDVIIPARYLNTASAAELAKHCMEDIDSGFAGRVKSGDVIMGGENFGCGSSREHAPLAIKASGTGCVIAKSFARIFYRNAVNIGLPILECPEASEKIGAGDLVEIDFDTGVVFNLTKNERYASEPFPPFIQDIIEAGGLLNSLKSREAAEETAEETAGETTEETAGETTEETTEENNERTDKENKSGGVGCE